MPDTLFFPAVKIGRPSADGSGKGTVNCSQSVSLPRTGAAVVSRSIALPPCRILNIVFDVVIPFDAATSAVATAGRSAGASEYAGPVDVRTAGRPAVAFAGGQLGNLSLLVDSVVTLTVTPVGASTGGSVVATITYAPL